MTAPACTLIPNWTYMVSLPSGERVTLHMKTGPLCCVLCKRLPKCGQTGEVCVCQKRDCSMVKCEQMRTIVCVPCTGNNDPGACAACRGCRPLIRGGGANE